MTEQMLYVWYDVDANANERGEWETIRQILNLGPKSIDDYLEIFNAFELITLEEQLEAEGWKQKEFPEQDDWTIIRNRLLTVWVKGPE